MGTPLGSPLENMLGTGSIFTFVLLRWSCTRGSALGAHCCVEGIRPTRLPRVGPEYPLHRCAENISPQRPLPIMSITCSLRWTWAKIYGITGSERLEKGEGGTPYLLLRTSCTFSSDHLRSSSTWRAPAGEASAPCSFPKEFIFPHALSMNRKVWLEPYLLLRG